MKAKVLTIVAVAAAVTLSFAFANVKQTAPKTKQPTTAPSSGTEPIGGFASDEK